MFPSCPWRAQTVALCKLLIEQPDLLLLDEPTNHLDAEAIHWLEQHLDQYPGTVVAVTHDRYFLDNVASGFWSWIAAKGFHLKATNQLGWNRNASVGSRTKASR